ncbi:MAG: hypothetical protein ABIO92_04210 [Chloroflexia bacterium]
MSISPIIVVDDTTQHVSAVNSTTRGNSPFCQWNWNALADSLMRPSPVVVLNIFQQYSPQVSVVDDQQLV